jgi:Heavy-metal resistance
MPSAVRTKRYKMSGSGNDLATSHTYRGPRMPDHLVRHRPEIESMKGSTMKKFLLAIAAAVGISAVAFHALAQAPGPHHGPGDPLAMIAAVKDKLNLNTSQQQQWDSVTTQGQAARQAARGRFAQLQAATQAEMAKADPDLVSLAAQADAIHQQNANARKAVRDGWLALYATFSTDQKGVVRDAIAAKFARMEQFRAHMRERFAQ